MADKVGYKFDCKDLLKRLGIAQIKAQANLLMIASSGAKTMENYAKTYRPWTDRTGNARRTLHGYVENKPTYVRIYIAHGMSYGWSLEYEHEKRYAILLPTVKACGAQILKSCKNVMKGW